MSFWRFVKKKQKRIYLDFAAATPVHPEVLAVMTPYFSKHFGNAGAIHKEGVESRDTIEDARLRLARLLRIREGNVIFTSGGTEANNLAILGTLEALREKGRNWNEMEVLTTKLEHPSVLKVMDVLEAQGVTITHVPVDGAGLIEISDFKKTLSEKVVLATFAYVNSETGVVQNVKKLTHSIRAYNTEHKTNIRTHLDASQAPLWLPCQMDALGVDMMTLDAGKCYGPKGAGALTFMGDIDIHTQTHGGSQEKGKRAGTENTPLIVGMVEAFVRAQEKWEVRSERVGILRKKFEERLLSEIPEAVVNGSTESRVANNVNISIPGFDSEYAVVVLDAEGIAAATRSACGGADGSGSHVVREMTGDDARADATLRFTLGEETIMSDITKAVRVLKKHIDMMRSSAV